MLIPHCWTRISKLHLVGEGVVDTEAVAGAEVAEGEAHTEDGAVGAVIVIQVSLSIVNVMQLKKGLIGAIHKTLSKKNPRGQ